MRHLMILLGVMMFFSIAHSGEILPEEVKNAKCRTNYNFTHVKTKRIIHIVVSGNSPRDFYESCVDTLESLFVLGYVPTHNYIDTGKDISWQSDVALLCSVKETGACE